MKKEACVIETSFEVANKVGGIYTVVSSKSRILQKKFRQYLCIGPYYPSQAEKRFLEQPLPQRYKKGVEMAQNELGVKVYYGKWILPSEPETFLIDFSSAMPKANDFKFWLWKEFEIDSLNAGNDFDEPVVWAMCAGKLIEKLVSTHAFDVPVVCQFHEWLAGPALLYVKRTTPAAKTVFTTHATVLGRTLSSSGQDLLGMIENHATQKFSPDELAAKYKVQAKHLTEKQSAWNADVFTTVSEITGTEAKALLGKQPDELTFNGLETENFPLMEDLSNLHIRWRNKLRTFVFRYFYPYYPIHVKKTLFIFLSGRHEIANKGIDVFIDALGQLNQQLKKEPEEDLTLIALVLVPYSNNGRNVSMLKQLALFEQMDDLVENALPTIKEDLLLAIGSGKDPSRVHITDKNFLFTMQALNKRIKALAAPRPPISPYELVGENEITQLFAKNGLQNKADDKVKVLYYPDYVSTTDGVLGMEYDQLVTGCHLGVFPSNYEPWGYTPIETAALGSPTITTDVSGFGQWVLKNIKKNKRKSIMVLERHHQPYDKVVKELFKMLHEFYHSSKKKRNSIKIEAKKLSYLTDWKKLIRHYLDAYDKALKTETKK